eukprot:6640882-Prymnesium_polylepis.1
MGSAPTIPLVENVFGLYPNAPCHSSNEPLGPPGLEYTHVRRWQVSIPCGVIRLRVADTSATYPLAFVTVGKIIYGVEVAVEHAVSEHTVPHLRPTK